jgi:hypothetical protein
MRETLYEGKTAILELSSIFAFRQVSRKNVPHTQITYTGTAQPDDKTLWISRMKYKSLNTLSPSISLESELAETMFIVLVGFHVKL